MQTMGTRAHLQQKLRQNWGHSMKKRKEKDALSCKNTQQLSHKPGVRKGKGEGGVFIFKKPFVLICTERESEREGKPREEKEGQRLRE